MSIETLIAENTAALLANTAQLAIIARHQEQLIAGQGAAIAKVEAAKPKRETAAEKKAREAAEAADAGAATEDDAGKSSTAPAATGSATTAADPASNDTSEGPTEDQLKATATAWVTKAEDEAEKKKRAEFLQTMARDILGDRSKGDELIYLTGPKSLLTAADRKKAVFYIKRAFKLGDIKHVTLGGAYDFDEAPDQDEPRAETPASAPAEEEFDPLG